ncbi:hypothetical protein FDUTEX481_04859 [Tolypothrix sp. PCC 7601]|nr:hypothetical protein FDUTEX481_04859 [Tolypothrix sp. PCC 7601]
MFDVFVAHPLPITDGYGYKLQTNLTMTLAVLPSACSLQQIFILLLMYMNLFY